MYQNISSEYWKELVKEFELDVFDNAIKIVWVFSRFCHSEILQLLKANFSSNITPKEQKLLLIFMFCKFFKLLWSICV